MDIEQEKIIRAAFLTISGLGSQRLRQLIAYFGSAVKAWESSASEYLRMPNQAKWIKEILLKRQSINPSEIKKALIKQGILLSMPTESSYPALIAELADAPPLLYYRGSLNGEAEVLAVVGSRQATAYGKAAAKAISRDSAANGLVIASGLARGIDTSAHQGALEVEGVTWAFLGCGLDRVYPLENRRLAEAIQERGALISEFPPGTPPLAQNFPARNRLISGCSRGVVVVEAAERSGALITVDFALEQGREVFAVPGPIFSKLSKGSHQLLRQGAKIVEGVEDIFNEFPIAYQQKSMAQDKQKQMPAEPGDVNYEHRLILQQLSDVPMHIDQITIHSTLPVSSISLGLLELQLSGKVKQLPGQHYVLAREC